MLTRWSDFEKISTNYHRSVASVEQTWAFHQARMSEFTAQGKQLRENLSFEDYLETNKRGAALIGQAMTGGKLYKQDDHKASPKFIMLVRILMLCLAVVGVVLVVFRAPEFYHLLEGALIGGPGLSW